MRDEWPRDEGACCLARVAGGDPKSRSPLEPDRLLSAHEWTSGDCGMALQRSAPVERIGPFPLATNGGSPRSSRDSE